MSKMEARQVSSLLLFEGTRISLDDTIARDLQHFRRGLACKAHTLVYHSSPGSRVIKKKKNFWISVEHPVWIPTHKSTRLCSNILLYNTKEGPDMSKMFYDRLVRRYVIDRCLDRISVRNFRRSPMCAAPE